MKSLLVSLLLVPSVHATSLTLGFTTGIGQWGKISTTDYHLASSDEGFCYVSSVAGDFGGDSEICRVFEDNGSFWLRVSCGTDECGCWATCMTLPANRTYGTVVAGPTLSGVGTEQVSTGLKTNESICAISEISGNYAGSGELCEIVPCDDEWCLYKTSGQSVMSCAINCLYMPTPNWAPADGLGGTDNFDVVTGAVGDADPIVSHYSVNEAMLGLWQVGGNFAGSGEYCGDVISSGYWALWAKSGQSTFRCGANYGLIPDNGWESASGYWDFVVGLTGGELEYSIGVGVVTTDSYGYTDTWGESATKEVSEDLTFLDKSVSETAYESMSVTVEHSISVGVIEEVSITCPYQRGYPFVRLYQWNIDLYHTGIGEPSTIKTNEYICQRQKSSARKVEPRCPPGYCANQECSKCSSKWWD